MSEDHSPKQALQDSLTQLAHCFQASQTTLPVEQIAECFEHLQDTDRTALTRLFLLIYQSGYSEATQHADFDLSRFSLEALNSCPERMKDHRSQSNASANPAPDQATARCQPSFSRNAVEPVRGNESTASRAARTDVLDDQRQCEAPAEVQQEVRSALQRESPLPVLEDSLSTSPLFLADPYGTPVSSSSEACSLDAQACLGLDQDGGEKAFRSVPGIVYSDEPVTLKFSTTIESLLQTCISDPSAFLRAVADGKVSLPNGRGWEAALVAKRHNADLRDLTRIFHRFECYNIYQHVVKAGFHTGAHWIRDMRPSLAERLSREFPDCFANQKAANKSLNCVDQGCRYREWAERLSDSGIDLGYLIALPSQLPHSMYTSRCTKEQIANMVIELQNLGISRIVHQMKLSALASHIVESLHEMTIRNQKTSPERHCSARQDLHSTPHVGDTTPSLSSDRSSLSCDSIMLDATQYSFGAFADSWLEDWTMEETSGECMQSCMPAETAAGFELPVLSYAGLRSPTLSDKTIASPSGLTETFNEWYQQ